MVIKKEKTGPGDNDNDDVLVEEAKQQQARRGTIKLDSSKAKLPNKPKASFTEFEKKADQVMDQKEDRKNKAVNLVKTFWGFIKNKSLIKNKGPIEQQVEKETVAKLVDFATELNNDENEPEGSGSVAIITLLLKTCMYLRDEVNVLNYQVAQLQEKLNKPSSPVGDKK